MSHGWGEGNNEIDLLKLDGFWYSGVTGLLPQPCSWFEGDEAKNEGSAQHRSVPLQVLIGSWQECCDYCAAGRNLMTATSCLRSSLSSWRRWGYPVGTR